MDIKVLSTYTRICFECFLMVGVTHDEQVGSFQR
jgi:hypothetical protein